MILFAVEEKSEDKIPYYIKNYRETLRWGKKVATKNFKSHKIKKNTAKHSTVEIVSCSKF